MGVKMLIPSPFDGWNKAEKQGIKTAQTALTHTNIMFPLPFIAMKIVCDGYAIIMHGIFSCSYAKCTVVKNSCVCRTCQILNEYRKSYELSGIFKTISIDSQIKEQNSKYFCS